MENFVIFSKKIRGCKNQNNKEIFGNIGLNEGLSEPVSTY